MKNYIISAKRLNLKLFSVLLLFGLLPSIYTTTRIYFLGNIPTDWGFNIASQVSWLSLLYEILQESIILPLFYIIGSILNNKDEFANRVKGGFIITFISYLILSILIYLFAKPLVIGMAQKKELVTATVDYIRLETISFIFIILVKYILIVLTVMSKHQLMYFILLFQMILTILLDTLLVSSLSFSLNLGVNGVAISNIIVNFLLLVIGLGCLKKNDINILLRTKIDFSWLREWSIVASYSGVETLVRNLVFIFVVVKMINTISEQATFWVVNNFIWGWLLVPILQLGELIKRDVAANLNDIKRNLKGYFLLTTIIVSIWILSIPIWQPFFQNIMNFDGYKVAFQLSIISVVFYILFAYSNIIDSIFYRIGRTEYMLFQSIVVNIVFYGTLFILFKTGIYKPTLTLITLMFAIGIAIDSILTFVMYAYLSREGKIEYRNNMKKTFNNKLYM